MKVLVTGANGLLGHNVVFELLKRHHQVRIIVRTIWNIYFDLSAVEVFIGNFTDDKTLKKAVGGCDAIIHIAAVTATNLIHYEDYSQINVIGARKLVNIANELNIYKIVFVSSANTIGYGTEHQPSDECYKMEFPFTESFYAKSKMEAEQIFITAAKTPNQHIVIVNPTFMIGAYDTKPSSGKLMIMGYRRRLMFVPKGGKNFVAVKNVSDVICNALTQGRNGERYLASGVNLSFKEYYELQKQVENYQQYLIEIPDFLLILIGKLGDILRKFGIRTELCSMNLQQLMIREYYSNQKAKTEMKLEETDLKIAVKDAIDWFKNHRMLKLL